MQILVFEFDISAEEDRDQETAAVGNFYINWAAYGVGVCTKKEVCHTGVTGDTSSRGVQKYIIAKV